MPALAGVESPDDSTTTSVDRLVEDVDVAELVVDVLWARTSAVPTPICPLNGRRVELRILSRMNESDDEKRVSLDASMVMLGRCVQQFLVTWASRAGWYTVGRWLAVWTILLGKGSSRSSGPKIPRA